jgi:hypothetical protein
MAYQPSEQNKLGWEVGFCAVHATSFPTMQNVLYETRQMSVCCKASLNRHFMLLFPTRLDFENSAEEFYPHKTLYPYETLIISLFINMMPHQHN